MKAGLRAFSSREHLQTLADKACRRWKVPTIPVHFSTHTYWHGECDYDAKCIRLFYADPTKRKRAGSGRNPAVLLHEVAHWIDYQLHGDEGDAHGAEFAAISADLFDWYGVIPIWAYKRLCKEYGVKLARLPQPHISHGHKRKRARRSSS